MSNNSKLLFFGNHIFKDWNQNKWERDNPVDNLDKMKIR